MMKKILPILALAVAALVVVSSGAFTSVTAERTATINVAGDAGALLALEPAAGSPNASYAHQDSSSGALVLDFSSTEIAATGVNVNATTVVEDVFTITNNGTQTVRVVLTKTGANNSANTGAIDFGDIESGVEIEPSTSATVSFKVTTLNTGIAAGQNILSSITLTATAVAASD